MNALRRVLRIVFGILEEISDQNAYRRYLATRGLAHSGETWRHFCDCRLQRKYQRAKCC